MIRMPSFDLTLPSTIRLYPPSLTSIHNLSLFFLSCQKSNVYTQRFLGFVCFTIGPAHQQKNKGNLHKGVAQIGRTLWGSRAGPPGEAHGTLIVQERGGAQCWLSAHEAGLLPRAQTNRGPGARTQELLPKQTMC